MERGMEKAEEARLREALRFAARKHEGQFRIGGDPYITHPLAVAEIVRGWGFPADYQITALFHDLLEDTDAAEEEIESLGGSAVLRAVRLLTKRPGYVMADYVAGIRSDPMAKAVKAADRLHNLRSALAAGEEFKRRYVLESLDWYLDFSPEIPPALKTLAESLETPLPEASLLYRPEEGIGAGRPARRPLRGQNESPAQPVGHHPDTQ